MNLEQFRQLLTTAIQLPRMQKGAANVAEAKKGLQDLDEYELMAVWRQESQDVPLAESLVRAAGAHERLFKEFREAVASNDLGAAFSLYEALTFARAHLDAAFVLWGAALPYDTIQEIKP